jgi:hypothetical protein
MPLPSKSEDARDQQYSTFLGPTVRAHGLAGSPPPIERIVKHISSAVNRVNYRDSLHNIWLQTSFSYRYHPAYSLVITSCRLSSRPRSHQLGAEFP